MVDDSVFVVERLCIVEVDKTVVVVSSCVDELSWPRDTPESSRIAINIVLIITGAMLRCRLSRDRTNQHSRSKQKANERSRISIDPRGALQA